VDPDDRHIYVSLGCAAENLAIAAAANGRAADIPIRTDQAAQIDVAFSPTRVQDGPL
jgi:hypothetical protein